VNGNYSARIVPIIVLYGASSSISFIIDIFEHRSVSDMALKGLNSFIRDLEKTGELKRISAFADPVLQITEIADRISKTGGRALLFENNGTDFPLLINLFGSEKRMAMALCQENLDAPAVEIDRLFKTLTGTGERLSSKLAALPALFGISRFMPVKRKGKGRCQESIHSDPDLGILPVLKCWPYDGGRYITLPVVHTYHPETGKPNAGMYRMQILDRNTTAMHWQMHKTGAAHYEAWKNTGKRMPVSVVLGGDPVYTYSATAPLPENIDEYILAGFLRRRSVKMVKCLTNDIWVPEDADIVIEGFVDPVEDKIWEGPFGDHTGFYSLADWYPKFHVTCITHAADAVYPATIVGIPPMEDSYIARATEKIFLAPVKLALQPEVEDLHMPDAGVAHNLVIVKIRKSYPGQGMKVINSLAGAGQMMFSKYIIVVSGDIDIRDYSALADHIVRNFDPAEDIVFTKGPLDVLDHASDLFAFGGKAGLDATVKLTGEKPVRASHAGRNNEKLNAELSSLLKEGIIAGYYLPEGLNSSLLILSADMTASKEVKKTLIQRLEKTVAESYLIIAILVDHVVSVNDIFIVAWQLLGNSDPLRDHAWLSADCLVMDGTAKFTREGGFPRRWPNAVCMDEETVKTIDQRWSELGFDDPVRSFSDRYRVLERDGREEVRQTS
jgi:4-hydroxy-3-polyprenylbenzoate decarboxylase